MRVKFLGAWDMLSKWKWRNCQIDKNPSFRFKKVLGIIKQLLLITIIVKKLQVMTASITINKTKNVVACIDPLISAKVD